MYGVAKKRFSLPRVASKQCLITNWLSHAWDNVSWYQFAEDKPNSTIEAVEALLVASIPGLLNGAQLAGQLGKRRYPGKDKNFASNTLWKKGVEDRSEE